MYTEPGTFRSRVMLRNMAISDWLRTFASTSSSAQGDSDTVRRIVGELDQLDPQRARYLAAFAYILSRVAGADRHISDAETRKIAELIQVVGHLPEAQAIIVAEIAKHQNLLFGATEDFLVTREFRKIASHDQRRMLLECLFAVSAADHAITPEEDAQIWQIAGELGFDHAEFVKARLPYSDKRTVLRPRPGT
jgi:uncharacterized tellurite resistance protein B-like protein